MIDINIWLWLNQIQVHLSPPAPLPPPLPHLGICQVIFSLLLSHGVALKGLYQRRSAQGLGFVKNNSIFQTLKVVYGSTPICANMCAHNCFHL